MATFTIVPTGTVNPIHAPITPPEVKIRLVIKAPQPEQAKRPRGRPPGSGLKYDPTDLEGAAERHRLASKAYRVKQQEWKIDVLSPEEALFRVFLLKFHTRVSDKDLAQIIHHIKASPTCKVTRQAPALEYQEALDKGEIQLPILRHTSLV